MTLKEEIQKYAGTSVICEGLFAKLKEKINNNKNKKQIKQCEEIIKDIEYQINRIEDRKERMDKICELNEYKNKLEEIKKSI